MLWPTMEDIYQGIKFWAPVLELDDDSWYQKSANTGCIISAISVILTIY